MKIEVGCLIKLRRLRFTHHHSVRTEINGVHEELKKTFLITAVQADGSEIEAADVVGRVGEGRADTEGVVERRGPVGR